MSEIGSPECELGRKEYWDEFYAQELQNFQEFGDTGDIWFGKKNLERIIDWLLQSKISKSSPVLDVGCGNGMTLISLAKVGFEDLTGVDYASEAIELAKRIAKNNNVDIKLKALDFLNSSESSNSGILNQTFDIIIDKGTYDAVCLNPDNVTEKREQYLKQVQKLLNTEGYFLLFSCNWTKEELLSNFIGFKLYDEIKIPSIGFGGKTGQTVTALVMKKDNQIL